MEIMDQKEVYNKYLTSCLADCNTDKGAYQNMASFYELNYSAHLPQNKGAKILDFGCGMGHFIYFLEKSGYTNFLGIDISEEAIKFCQNNVSKKVILITDPQKFFEEKKENFDVIVLNDVIEHLPKNEIISILIMLKNRLREDGSLIAKTSNAGSITGSYMRYHDFTHEINFTEQSLRQVLLLAGFSKVDIMPIKYYKATNIKRALRLFLNYWLHFVWKLFFYIEYQDVPRIVTNLMIGVAKK